MSTVIVALGMCPGQLRGSCAISPHHHIRGTGVLNHGTVHYVSGQTSSLAEPVASARGNRCPYPERGPRRPIDLRRIMKRPKVGAQRNLLIP